MSYYEIKCEITEYRNPEVFYAFSQKQFDENRKRIPEGEKIYQGFVSGQYGTYKGLTEMLNHIEAVEEKIRANCTPQEIYNYEYDNHECGYTGDDSEALEIVNHYFPGAQIKRKRHW